MAAGGCYWTFVSEELPEIAQNFFGLSTLRADNFVAGNSMGGYGAFKMALAKPERFCAAASLSGALDLATNFQRIEAKRQTEWKNIFGDMDQIEQSANSLLFLAQEMLKTGQPQPRLYQWCGTEDFYMREIKSF